MKKLFCLFLVISTFTSCQEEIKFNNPSFQGIKDNVFWRAISYDATLSSSRVLTIKAYTRNEIVTLKTSTNAVNTYALGTGISNIASYEINNKMDKIIFSTGIDYGDGEIVITNYDAVNKTVSGTFKFNVDNIGNNPLYGSSINFQNGFFYQIPIN